MRIANLPNDLPRRVGHRWRPNIERSRVSDGKEGAKDDEEGVEYACTEHDNEEKLSICFVKSECCLPLRLTRLDGDKWPFVCDFYMFVRYLLLLRDRYSLWVYGENLPRDFQRYETAR